MDESVAYPNYWRREWHGDYTWLQELFPDIESYLLARGMGFLPACGCGSCRDLITRYGDRLKMQGILSKPRWSMPICRDAIWQVVPEFVEVKLRASGLEFDAVRQRLSYSFSVNGSECRVDELEFLDPEVAKLFAD